MGSFEKKHFDEYCHGRRYEETINEHLFTFHNLAEVYRHCLGSVSDDWLYDNRTFLDCGCAMGHVISGMMGFGMDAYGYDSSSYATNNLLPDVQDRVWFGDHDSVLEMFDDQCFDIVYSNGFQYSKDEDEILRWLRRANRVCSNSMILMTITEETRDKDDIFQWSDEMQIIKPSDWWTSLCCLAGFEKVIWTPWSIALCLKREEDGKKITGSI